MLVEAFDFPFALLDFVKLVIILSCYKTREFFNFVSRSRYAVTPWTIIAVRSLGILLSSLSIRMLRG